MQILPPKELLPYIKHYLFLESAADPQKTLRLFSDGNTGMVFLLNEGQLSINRSDHLPHSFLYGQISHFKDLCLIERISFIIVVFQPDGIYKLLGIPAHELKDQIIGLKDIFGQSADRLYDQLMCCKHPTAKLNALNTFFYTLDTRHKSLGQTSFSNVLKYITDHKGLLSVEELLKLSGHNERQMERIFAEQVGMSPKKFGSIVQLHFFLKLLRNKPDGTTLTTISYESGYFDQSHLIRTFKKYTGFTPSIYLNNTCRLAINFMEFQALPDRLSDLYNLS
ncbi:DUF6597 domain-containing transcriptional factor [Sphingobacterium sp. NGMCC 1.201703]|uniref:DUF6597 domain-containing transcriptional factor n=1 Tax=Sphingobacterium sp. NGMCC 1.201703 TaxID=3388657 RepID=UPI0039FD4C65